MAPKRNFVPDDIWRLRTVSDPQVSPDGRRVAFVVAVPSSDTDKAETSIWVAETDGSDSGRPFTSGPDDSSPRWSPDGQWLAFVAERGDGPQLYLASLGGGEPRAITAAAHGVSQPAWSPDGQKIAFVARCGEWKEPEDRSPVERSAPRVVTGLYHRYDGQGWFDERRSQIFVVSIHGGDAVQITDGDYDNYDPDWSPDGRQLAFVSDRNPTRFDENHRDIWVITAYGSGRRQLRRLTGGEGGAAAPRWSPDGQKISYIGHLNADGNSASNTHLMVLDAKRAGSPTSLSAPLDRTVWGMLRAPGVTHSWTADSRHVDFAAVDGGSFHVYRAALDGIEAPRLIIGGDRQVVAFHSAGGVLAFASFWVSEPSEIYCVDTDGGRERRVSDVNRDARAIRWAPVKRIRTRSADGVVVESLVLHPPGRDKTRPSPTVLEIHGGPHGWHPQTVFTGLYQSLAAAGYVVVLPNPRGSHGYGETFSQACVGDWGGADYEDLMGVVDALVADGTADPERLFVAGYSYGGFMTGWIVGHTDRFAAACVSAPVVDLVSMWGTTDIPNFEQYEMEGLPWEQPERYLAQSPLTYLPQVTTPVALFHWEGDLRCPIGQAEEFFQILRKLGREVILVRYPGGYHIVRTTSQMVDYVKRHLDWFADH
jgi:dipeptidyl aminopeptidase/acylaminoacyl peptidase